MQKARLHNDVKLLLLPDKYMHLKSYEAPPFLTASDIFALRGVIVITRLDAIIPTVIPPLSYSVGKLSLSGNTVRCDPLPTRKRLTRIPNARPKYLQETRRLMLHR